MSGIKDLTTGSIRKQLFNLAMPIMGTSFIQMAYSLTDMAWVGTLGSEAVAAIGAVGILTWMTTSLTYLNKVGAEVSVGQSIGSGQKGDARRYASHNITMSLAIALCWGLLLFAAAKPVIGFYKLEDHIAAQAVSYLRIVSTAFPFIFLAAAFTGIYNASGMSRIPFYISGTGLAMNMALDPLFILGFGMGTDGAAWATWISQAVVCLLFVYNLKIRHPLFGNFYFLTTLKRKYTVRIIKLGTPVALMNMLFAFINLFMARIASSSGGHLGVMALTAGGQIEAIAWNTSQGFSTALSAFTAQNFAARCRDRVVRAYRSTLLMTTVWGVMTLLLFVLFGNEVFSIFVSDPEAYTTGGEFLRIDGYSMPLMMVEITIQGLFYGTGRTVPPAIISITFNCMRVPLAIMLSATSLGLAGVWWAVSITSMLKGVAAFVWFTALQKRIWNS